MFPLLGQLDQNLLIDGLIGRTGLQHLDHVLDMDLHVYRVIVHGLDAHITHECMGVDVRPHFSAVLGIGLDNEENGGLGEGDEAVGVDFFDGLEHVEQEGGVVECGSKSHCCLLLLVCVCMQ